MNDGSKIKTHALTIGFEPTCTCELTRSLNWLAINCVYRSILQLRVFGGVRGTCTPMPFPTLVFKTSAILFRDITPLKNSTQCFALAILPSLLKPAIYAVAHILQDSNPQLFITSEYTIEFAVCVTSTLRIVDFGRRGGIRTRDLLIPNQAL